MHDHNDLEQNQAFILMRIKISERQLILKIIGEAKEDISLKNLMAKIEYCGKNKSTSNIDLIFIRSDKNITCCQLIVLWYSSIYKVCLVSYTVDTQTVAIRSLTIKKLKNNNWKLCKEQDSSLHMYNLLLPSVMVAKWNLTFVSSSVDPMTYLSLLCKHDSHKNSQKNLPISALIAFAMQLLHTIPTSSKC